MIRVNDLTFSYYDEENVLENINLNLKDGTIYALVGKNGAGKTTLLKCLSRTMEGYKGDVIIEGKTLFVNDNPVIFEYMTGQDYLDFIADFAPAENLEVTTRLIDELEIREYLDSYIINYSLGTKHKIALITALMLGHNNILVDEPMKSLDPYATKSIIDFLKSETNKNRMFVISTNILDPAYQVADIILLIDDKNIIELENNFENFEDFRNKVNQLLIKDKQ